MRIKIVFLFMVFCSVAVNAEDRPFVEIPFLKQVPKLDGKIDRNEWRDAIRIECGMPKGPYDANNSTFFYAKYDANTIYIAAVCEERAKGYPEAFRRKSTDDLTQDDAVQVVLGLSDRNILKRDVAMMGGYVGAMGTEAAAADYFYQFTVNAVGSQSRSYNESVLERSGFNAATAKDSNGWSVEMCVPFSSCGVDPIADPCVYMNFFRFRPPAMVGWYMPGWGGYVPIPLGRAKLSGPLDKPAYYEPVEGKVNKEKAIVASEPVATLIYEPLCGVVGAVIKQSVPEQGLKVSLEVEGIGNKTVVLQEKSEQSIKLEFAPGTQPRRSAKLMLTDKNDKVIVEISKTFEAVDKPEWLGTQAGIEYVDKKIPRPWTAPIIDQNSVTLVNKTIRFGSLGLYESISDTLGELLAGPAEAVVELDGKKLTFKTDFLKTSHEGQFVRVESQASCGSVILETQSLLEYDGFTRIKLRIRGIEAQKLSRLALRFPLRAHAAKYVHRDLVQEVKELTGFGYQTNAGPLWLGSEDKGLAFSFDTNPFLSSDPRRQIKIIEDGDTTKMELNFVDAIGQLTEQDYIFQFFLQPTPTKPMDLKKVHSRIQWYWEQWSAWQGYPDLSKKDQWKQWFDYLHRQNYLGILYTCQGLAENAPGFSTFKDDFIGWPEWVFYRRGYNPGMGVPCYYTCKRGPEGDLQLWAFDILAREAGLDGIVSDGLSLAWSCENIGHKHGCGDVEPITWDSDVRSRTVETRTFLKRMRGIFDSTGRDFYFAAHCGGGLQIDTLSFFDAYMEGEQLNRFRPGYRIPRSTYAVGYNGYPWGIRTIFWDRHWRGKRGFFWSLTYALLHDNEIEDTDLTRRIYAGFEDANTTYYPYWRKGSHVKLDSAHSSISYYRNENAALVVVGNLNFDPDQVKLDISGLYPGEQITVENVLTSEAVKLDKLSYAEKLDGYKCVVLRVNRNGHNGAIWAIDSYDANDWTVVNVKGENAKPEFSSGSNSLKINNGESLILNRTFGSELYVKLDICQEGKIRIALGEATLVGDGKWNAEGVQSFSDAPVYASVFNGKLFDPPIKSGTLVPLEISVSNGLLDATYNNQPLARGLRLINPASLTLKVSSLQQNGATVTPLLISNDSRQLFAPGILSEYLDLPYVEDKFSIKQHSLSDWRINTDSSDDEVTGNIAMANGKKGTQLVSSSSPSKGLAYAKLADHTVGRNCFVALRLKIKDRFRLRIGSMSLVSNGTWSLEGIFDGWNEGKLYQVPLEPDKEHTLIVNLKDGVLNAVLDGLALAKDMDFMMSPSGNEISIETWAGDSVTFLVETISNEGKSIEDIREVTVKHPIL